MTSKSWYLECETKLSATLEFDLPDLGAAAGRTERLADEDLHSRYFDTADLRLWSRGITLRHRAGDRPDRGTWTLKLPESEDRATLERTELSWPGGPETVPRPAVQILQGIVRRSPLGPITELRTTRRRFMLQEPDGSAWGELDDDIVTVVGGEQDGMRFRQIEVEVRPDSPPAAHAVLTALKVAGAQSDAQTKLARALGLTAPSKRPATPKQAVKDTHLGDVVRRSIAEGLDRILDHDYRLRLDADVHPRDVHQMRVATRRLRSNLKTFRAVLDPIWVAHTRDELRWLGDALGRVRDRDVLASEIGGKHGNSRLETEGQAELRATLMDQRHTANRRLIDALAAERYLNLLDRLHAAAEMPPFLDHKTPAGRTASAGASARHLLPDLVDDDWRTLRRKLRKARRRPSDRTLHRIRIRAKQLRYAAEAAAPIIGKPARRTAAAAENLQTVLGQHHDAVGAEAWLRRQAVVGSPRQAFRAGQLTVIEQQHQEELRSQWHAAAKRLTKKQNRRWMP